MRGFSLRSPEDWEQGDHTGGCTRNTPLDCSTRNHSGAKTIDKFYPLPYATLPTKGDIIGSVGSTEQCEQACLDNCSCSAYAYSSGERCSLWYDDLLNIRSYTNGTTDDGGILYLRIAAKDAYNWRNSKRSKRKIIGAIIAASVVVLSMLSAFFHVDDLEGTIFSHIE